MKEIENGWRLFRDKVEGDKRQDGDNSRRYDVSDDGLHNLCEPHDVEQNGDG